MAYVTGYKRARPEEADLGVYTDYSAYGGASTDFAPLTLPGPVLQPLQPPLMQAQVQPQLQTQFQAQLQPQLQNQAIAAESIRLGSAPDGTLPVVKLRGLPFSCDIDSINLFLVRP